MFIFIQIKFISELLHKYSSALWLHLFSNERKAHFLSQREGSCAVSYCDMTSEVFKSNFLSRNLVTELSSPTFVLRLCFNILEEKQKNKIYFYIHRQPIPLLKIA